MKYSCLGFVLTSALILTPAISQAAVHVQKAVTFLQTAPSNAPCVYFQLAGVATADSSVSASPVFALHKDHPGYVQAYAMLMAAKLTSTPVRVSTTGSVANSVCGNYAGVHEVQLE